MIKFAPQSVPQRRKLLRGVSHYTEKKLFLEYLPKIAKEIKIILKYHSVGPKEGFDAK